MHPTFLAFTWVLWRQQRVGLLTILGYLLVAAAVSAALPAYCTHEVAQNVCGWLLALTLPVIGIYLAAVFTFGADNGDILGRASCFPSHLFRLPVPTRSLVGWPLLGGAAAIMLLWLATAWFILRPWMERFDDAVPIWWPALFMAAALAWVQMLLWSPFGLPGLRIVLLILLTLGIIWSGVVSSQSREPEYWLAALYAGLTLAAWTVSYLVVRRARSGDIPNWDAMIAPLRRLTVARPTGRTPFVSAARAQTWLEWHLSGYTLPIMTALVLPTQLVFLALGKNDVLSTERTLLGVLAMPVFLAGLAGMSASGKSRGVKDHFGIAPFIASLPMSAADMIGAKLKAAALSALATWTLIGVVVPLAIVCTGNLDTATGWWQQAVQERHPVQVIAGIAAALVVLFTWTWKRKVDCLYIGLSGREWLVATLFIAAFFGAFGGWMLAIWVLWHPEMYKSNGLSGRPMLGAVLFIVSIFGSIGLAAAVWWIYAHPETHALALAVLPWLLGTLMLCRFAATGLGLQAVLRRGLLQPATAVRWIAVWLLLASLLFGVLAWAVPAERVPLHYIAFAVLFAMPMARLASAPLALAWNRHR